ncbi:MAG: N-methyl-L-tryptophan oxidase [Verrucomicrobiota bacterium]
MSPDCYDVLIIGLGATGSAAGYHLARRGVSVLGLDRYIPPHSFGSSHGQTRIIREAYFEDPAYVPLVQRAYELWADLEEQAGQRLFVPTGGLMIGPTNGTIYVGAKRSADEHHLPHQLLTSDQVRQQFPMFAPEPGTAAVLEPRAGVLFPERCIEAHLRLGQEAGASWHCGESVSSWNPEGEVFRVITDHGQYAAKRLLFCAGAWTKSLLPDLALPLVVERQVLFWFDAVTESACFRPGQCPIYLWEYGDGQFFYGFPDMGEGVKIAGHHAGRLVDPDRVDREVTSEEVSQMREVLRRYVPLADGPLRSTAVCLYTNTPDYHFVIDRHPTHPQILIASPCSGHGFKFSSAIGETLADLITTGSSRFDLRLFRLDRFR